MDIWIEIQTDRERGARRLVAEYGDRLFATACLLCRNAEDAEELVFRTLERAVTHIASYEPRGDFLGWLSTIQLNFWRMDVRKNRPHLVPMGTVQELPEVADETLVDALSGVDTELIRTAVRQLPPLFSEVLILRFFEGRSLEEIAEMNAIPLGTVKSRLNHAKAALRAALEELKGGQS